MLYPAAYKPRVARRGVHSDLVRMLGTRILRGDYQPGDILPKAEALSVELGVSRSVVREAMRVLAEKGLIAARQRTGTWVRERDDWNVADPELISWRRQLGPDLPFLRDLSEVRLVIEPNAALLAAGRASPGEVAEMRRLYHLMEESLDDPERYANADLGLHATILRATHNALLTQLTNTISEALVASRDVTVQSASASAASMPLHEAVIEAIGRQDGGAAAARMSELVLRTLADINDALGGTDATPGHLVATMVPPR